MYGKRLPTTLLTVLAFKILAKLKFLSINIVTGMRISLNVLNRKEKNGLYSHIFYPLINLQPQTQS